LEEEVGDCNNLPTSVVGVSFRFVPSHDVHYNGVYASSRKGMQLAHGSSINPYYVIRTKTVEYTGQRHLPGLQRMLSTGEIRPWNRYREGKNCCLWGKDSYLDGDRILTIAGVLACSLPPRHSARSGI